MGLNLPGLKPLGFVPVLADILHKLRCTIVPLRYGAGIKGKVLESFAHGLPCVMSEVAAEGLELPKDWRGWSPARGGVCRQGGPAAQRRGVQRADVARRLALYPAE